MNWNIQEAQHQFSELIQAARQEPQLIYEQDQVVAAVIEGTTLEQFLDWHSKQHLPSIAEKFASFRQTCAEEDYVLEVPPRQDRPNPFESSVEHVSL